MLPEQPDRLRPDLRAVARRHRASLPAKEGVHSSRCGSLITQELDRHRPGPYEPNVAESRERANLLPARLPRTATCFGIASRGKEDQLSRLARLAVPLFVVGS